jgi:hypothetical protein
MNRLAFAFIAAVMFLAGCAGQQRPDAQAKEDRRQCRKPRRTLLQLTMPGASLSALRPAWPATQNVATISTTNAPTWASNNDPASRPRVNWDYCGFGRAANWSSARRGCASARERFAPKIRPREWASNTPSDRRPPLTKKLYHVSLPPRGNPELLVKIAAPLQPNAGITSRVNNSTERSASARVMSPNASHGAK